MSKRSDRDVINTRLSVAANVLEIHSAGSFQGNATGVIGNALHCFSHRSWIHVVEQDRFGSVGQRFFEFFHGADFDLYRLRSYASFMSFLENLRDSAA